MIRLKDATQADVGSHVIFTDPTGGEHDALITAVWGTQCINVVIVLKDPSQKDNYGRKTFKGYTSVTHGNVVQAHGNFWLWPNEERTQPPLTTPNPLTE